MNSNIIERHMEHEGFSDLTHDLLKRGLQVRFRARGNSMYPAIAHNEFVTVAPLDEKNDIKIGDIVLSSINDKLIAHRVINIKEVGEQRVLLIKGDSVSRKDEIYRDQILGKIIAVERDNEHEGFDTGDNRPKQMFLKKVLASIPWLYPGIRKLKKRLRLF